MKNVFDSFNNEINELRQHINFSEILHNEIKNESSVLPYVKSSIKKKYDYKSLIITIYGIVEFYIEELIKNYLSQTECTIPKYELLKAKIKENHFNNSIQLTSKIIENKHNKYKLIDKELVIINLKNCIDNKVNYKINFDAFLIASGNLKHVKICDIFRLIDIQLDNELRKTNSFFSNVKSENLFNKLDDLVDRRNEIAHGNDNNLLATSEIIPIVDFLELYFHETYNIIVKDLENERLKYVITEKSTVILNYTKYKGNIIGFENISNIDFKVGDNIIIQQNDDNIFQAEILSLKKYKGNLISLKLNKNIRYNYNFFIPN